MKKTISIVALLLAAVLMVSCLAACGNKPANGTYKVVEMKGEDGTDMSSEIAAMEQYGVSIDLIIDGDKATFMGQECEIKDGKLIAGDESIPFTVSGDKITLEEDGKKIVFQKK